MKKIAMMLVLIMTLALLAGCGGSQQEEQPGGNGVQDIVDQMNDQLEEQGKNLLRIDRFFPSSQICSCCGEKDPVTKDLSVRRWRCIHCEAEHDRDINAAVNIRNEGIRMISG